MVFVAGHFGEWLQGTVGAEGKIGLVTLSCPIAGVRAVQGGQDPLSIEQNDGLIDVARCRAFLADLGLFAQGRVQLWADLPPGGGAGMSTASLVALARAMGADEGRIAQACLCVEGATDPLMLAQPDSVLWAPREARVLHHLPCPPHAEIVGGFWGPPLRTDPNDNLFPAIDDLVVAWAQAPSLCVAARLASISAKRTTDLRGPDHDPTSELGGRLGALGYSRAHTGSARALIFAPGTVPATAEAALLEAGYTHPIRFRTGGRI